MQNNNDAFATAKIRASEVNPGSRIEDTRVHGVLHWHELIRTTIQQIDISSIQILIFLSLLFGLRPFSLQNTILGTKRGCL